MNRFLVAEGHEVKVNSATRVPQPHICPREDPKDHVYLINSKIMLLCSSGNKCLAQRLTVVVIRVGQVVASTFSLQVSLRD